MIEMKRKLFLILPFAFLLFSFAACVPSAAPISVSDRRSSPNGLPPRKNLEEMTWQKFDGTDERLKDLKGKVVILDFWATYCKPCLEGIPHFVELQKKHQDLRVIGLHVGGEEDQPKVPAFVDKLNINYTLGYPERDLSEFLLKDDSRIPQTFVLDKIGKLVKQFVGFDDQIKADIDKAVEESLAK
jgi:thiol-disulfide isomerase/thioredoxin